ncbi:MAG: PQQ-binding-like beta-propeller repeat protein, partial [Acidobacteria bacterium]|nr:PQQ-binding-like beta-propeller repeat protein [Acidobacteriota bacterium]
MHRVRSRQVGTGSFVRRAAAEASRTLFLIVLVLAVDRAAAQDWAQFRGPGAAGVVADNPDLPERWSATENVAWRTPLPGLGWSSPIVAGGLVFLTTVVSDGEVETPE